MADSIAQSSERVRSQALDDAESLGSPIVTVVTKRIRAAKKRLTKIERIEAKAQEQPDKIDKDQVSASDVPWRRLLPNARIREASLSKIHASLELPCSNRVIAIAAVPTTDLICTLFV
jgi:hypothetical protein